MYCIKCGVEIGDHEKKCPLCGTAVVNPDFINTDPDIAPFPKQVNTSAEMSRSGILFVLTFLFSLPAFLTVICDLSINYTLVWSGYAVGSLLLCYVIVVFPLWFKCPNPAIFVSVDFSSAILFLLYINYTLNGDWFLTFALPVSLMVAVVVCTVITLMHYLKSGYLYIIGGASIALSFVALSTETLLGLTFYKSINLVWSIYPFIVFIMVGVFLIIIAICTPLRESLKRKFFL